jgi:hypothetical protein
VNITHAKNWATLKKFQTPYYMTVRESKPAVGQDINNSSSMPVPLSSGKSYTGRYVVWFKDEVTRDEVNALALIDGFSFPDNKESYDDSFNDLHIIIGMFLASLLALFGS